MRRRFLPLYHQSICLPLYLAMDPHVYTLYRQDIVTSRSNELPAWRGIEDLDLILKERRLRWYGHVEHSNGAVKTAFHIQVEGKHGPGRPKITWKLLRYSRHIFLPLSREIGNRNVFRPHRFASVYIAFPQQVRVSWSFVTLLFIAVWKSKIKIEASRGDLWPTIRYMYRE